MQRAPDLVLTARGDSPPSPTPTSRTPDPRSGGTGALCRAAGVAQTSKEHVGPSNTRTVGSGPTRLLGTRGPASTTRAMSKSEAEPRGTFHTDMLLFMMVVCSPGRLQTQRLPSHVSFCDHVAEMPQEITPASIRRPAGWPAALCRLTHSTESTDTHVLWPHPRGHHRHRIKVTSTLTCSSALGCQGLLGDPETGVCMHASSTARWLRLVQPVEGAACPQTCSTARSSCAHDLRCPENPGNSTDTNLPNAAAVSSNCVRRGTQSSLPSGVSRGA